MHVIIPEMPDICSAEVLPQGSSPFFGMLGFQWDPEFMYEWSVCKHEEMAHKMHYRYNCSLWSFTCVVCSPMYQTLSYAMYQISV